MDGGIHRCAYGLFRLPIKHDLVPQCRAWACMHSHVHYALACRTVFTLDYSCAGLEFGRERWSFVQALITDCAWWWCAGWHLHLIRLLNKCFTTGKCPKNVRLTEDWWHLDSILLKLNTDDLWTFHYKHEPGGLLSMGQGIKSWGKIPSNTSSFNGYFPPQTFEYFCKDFGRW